MQRFFGVVMMIFFTSMAFGQSSVDIKDPKAKAILDKISAELASYESVEMDFEFIIEFPGAQAEVQKGKIIQKDDKYFVDMEMQSVYSDGKSLWLHMKNNNEVQWSNVEEAQAGGFMDPTSLINMYKTGEYAYAITGEENGNQMIEFKPLDKASPYFKMRLSVVKGKNKVNSMKVFSKDGSNYTMKLSDMKSDKNYPADTFVFDKSKHPGVHVEDLRIN
jgi:outer membrane lipoprotein-sorting protein